MRDYDEGRPVWTTPPSGRAIRVLIVDEALDFGGSIVSTANLIRGLDRHRFVPIMVSAAERRLVGEKLRDAEAATVVRVVRKVFHYNRLAAWTRRIGKIPLRPLRKLLIYGLYVLRLVANVAYSIRIVGLMLKHRVDLVQLNNGLEADEVQFLCLLLGKPRVVFLRGYTPMSRIERAFFLPGVKHFVAVSEHIKERAVRDGVDPQSVTVATPPAIVEEVTAREVAAVRARHGLRPDEPTFGIVGRVVRWKGQAEFLRAARLVFERVPRSRALVVGGISDGDEEYLDELRRYVDAEGMRDRVVFTGYRHDIDAYYSVLDVLLHCSIAPEPSGRVIFEAMSYGVPVVASCRGGPKEFVESGVDGYIVDPEDAEAVANRALSLLTDVELRRTFGGRARRKMKTHYNKDVYARKIQDVYLEAVAASAVDGSGR